MPLGAALAHSFGQLIRKFQPTTTTKTFETFNLVEEPWQFSDRETPPRVEIDPPFFSFPSDVVSLRLTSIPPHGAPFSFALSVGRLLATSRPRLFCMNCTARASSGASRDPANGGGLLQPPPQKHNEELPLRLGLGLLGNNHPPFFPTSLLLLRSPKYIVVIRKFVFYNVPASRYY